MAPKPKSVPSRLGPPPQLAQLSRIPMVAQQQKFQPKMREIMSRQAKILARWLHETLTWKKILMSWMVVLVASKMVLLMLTYEFFTLTSLISLQVGPGFHALSSIARLIKTVEDMFLYKLVKSHLIRGISKFSQQNLKIY